MMNAAYAASQNQGIAQCTQGRDKTANKLYNTWMMHYYPDRKCIEDIVDGDITADNIVLLFAEYAQLLIHIQFSMVGPTQVLGLGRNKKILIILVWRQL